MEETTDLWNVDIFAIWETLDMKSEELSGSKLMGISEESGYDKR